MTVTILFVALAILLLLNVPIAVALGLSTALSIWYSDLPLTIVVQPIQAIGETAATLLMKRLRDDRTGFPVIQRLKTSLVLGDSVRRTI